MNQSNVYIWLCGIMMVWGLNVVAVKVLVEQFDPVAMTSLRIFVAGVGVLLVLAFMKKWRIPSMSELSYQLGEYHDGLMYWTDPKDYDTGVDPSIATLPNGDVIEVHTNGGNTLPIYNLYYNLGKYENGEINWYSIGNKYDNGSYPNITVTSDGDIVEVHNKSRDSDKLFYNYGSIIDRGNDRVDISWGDKGEEYGTGYEAFVMALSHGGTASTVLKTQKALDTHLWYSINQLDRTNNKINRISMLTPWEPHDVNSPVSYQLDNGELIMMFHRGSATWFQMASYEYAWNRITFNTRTITEFDGQNNDVVQLQNGLMLNVHENPKKINELRYVLGEYDEQYNRVVWWTD